MRHTSAIVLFCVITFAATAAKAQVGPGQTDSHRPACETEACKEIKQFVRTHYCGESPFGGGPSDGCDLRVLEKNRLNSKAVTDFRCPWNEQTQASVCHQSGVPPEGIRRFLRRELARLGLPKPDETKVVYRVLELSGLTVAQAFYSRARGADLWQCGVILAFSNTADFKVLREVRYTKTDVDVPKTTTWSVIDLADVDGDGAPEIVLRGNAYEDHWFEVFSVRPSGVTLIFSGLGYYL